MPTRIYVVDDHPLVRQGLSQILASEADMEFAVKLKIHLPQLGELERPILTPSS
jgi:DNA-binding NarL/FixJ family response regulator